MSAAQVLAAVAAAAVLALLAWRRRRLSREQLVVGGALAVALGVYASGVLGELPDVKKLIGDVAGALGPWTYALVGALAFLETGAFVGLVAPGETVVIAGGVVAGQGEISLLPLIGLVWLCAVLGDTTSFFIGRRLGRQFLERHGPKVGITAERLDRVEGYFQRYGGRTILIGRFIGLVRALAPFIAGSSRLSYASFIPYSVLGTALWSTTFCVLGYVFWQSFDRVAHIAGQATFAFGAVAAVVAGVWFAYRNLRDEETRRRVEAWMERQHAKPLLRPLFALLLFAWRRLLRPLLRVLVPAARGLWRRMAPGGLGIELATVLAVAGAGLYVFVLYMNMLSDDPGLTPFDREMLDFTERIRSDTLTTAAKLVTDLGSFPTVATLVLAAAIALVVQGRRVELGAFLLGAVLVYFAVQLAKAGVDRPRPPAQLVVVEGSSYPSGHAAYSTVWVAAAVALARGLATRVGLVVVALVISAAIGASRVYLHVHYWSDVAGGWGLGYGIFGVCAFVALVVSQLRHNERPVEQT